MLKKKPMIEFCYQFFLELSYSINNSLFQEKMLLKPVPTMSTVITRVSYRNQSSKNKPLNICIQRLPEYFQIHNSFKNELICKKQFQKNSEFFAQLFVRDSMLLPQILEEAGIENKEPIIITLLKSKKKIQGRKTKQ